MIALEDPDPHLVSVFHNSLPHSRNQVINGEPDFGEMDWSAGGEFEESGAYILLLCFIGTCGFGFSGD